MIIYKITNVVNNKIYIGKTEKSIKERMNVHIKNAERNTNRYLYDAMNHYGYENFTIEAICEANSSSELNELEKKYISLYKANNREYGYNMTDGGTGGVMNDDAIKKAKITRMERYGSWMTPEGREKQVEGIKKYFQDNPTRPPFSDTWRENIGKGIREKWNNDMEFRNRSIKNCHMRGKSGELHHFFGHNHTFESRKKMAESATGRPTSDKQKDVARKRWTGAGNPNHREVDMNIVIELLLQNKKLPEILQYFKNITKQGLWYKIRNELNVSGMKEIDNMIKTNTFVSYLQRIGRI